MSYTIRYDMQMDKKYPSAVHRRSGKKWYRFVVVVFVCVLLYSAVQYRDTILQWIIPGDAQTTIAALQDFAADIRRGMPTGEAITVFCREIIAHAEG